MNYFRVENRLHEITAIPNEGEPFQEFVERNRRQIEPWLSAIFQSEHLALLAGSGLSAGLANAVNAQALTMATTSILPELDGEIAEAATASARRMGRGTPNLEDQLRACVALLAGLEIINDARVTDLRNALRRELVRFANAVVESERSILAAVAESQDKAQAFRDLLASFLLSFASRTASRDRLHLFTTNYDRVIDTNSQVKRQSPRV
jgi:hypothetical protein